MLEGTTIKAVRKLAEKSFEVDLETKLHTGKVMAETVNVNTILVAIGRDPRPDAYSGIGIDLKNGKIVGRKNEPERTSIDHIYAVGDAVLGVPELMPVAQKSGRLLAKRVHLRLSKNEPSGAKITEQEILDKYSTDYNFIPTTVFSPTEYSFIGLSEEEAEKAYGKDSIEVYHRETTPLQFSLYKSNTKLAYMKVVVASETGKVVGMHYFGPAADEIIGGFAVAMKLGMTKDDLDSTIGVHPSTSEDLFNLDVTKRSGEEFRKTEC